MIVVGGDPLDHLEALGTWQWCNFLESLAPAGKQVVRINLDETCCRLCTEATKGAVAVGRNRSRKEALIGEHKASLSARRLAVTLVASVCDDTEIQALRVTAGCRSVGGRRVRARAERVCVGRATQKWNAEPDARERRGAGRTRKNRRPRHTNTATCICSRVKRSGLLVRPANSSRPAFVLRFMASSCSDQAATGGAVVLGAGAAASQGEELGEQIVNLKKQQQALVREKKRLQANLRNAQRKKVRLCKRTRMLSDTDLLAIMRMRAANSKDTKGEPKPAEAAEAKSSGGAASSDAATPAAVTSSKASEGNAEELEHMDSEGSPAA